MKRIKIVGVLCSLALVLVTQTSKADDIALGDPIMNGSGCPIGTAEAVLSPDNKTLTILFDSFVAEAGRDVGHSVSQKACNIAIPIHIPQGLSVSILSFDYRGFASVPAGGMARFSASYFFAGSQGPTASKLFMGPQNTDYLVNNKLAAIGLVWSPCGADTNLRVNTSMMARSNMRGEEVLATVDSADIKAGLVYQLQWQQCW